MPPLNLVEPRDAVQQVRNTFQCTGDEAIKFLCDRWIIGEISPRFIAGEPPGGADPGLADWFTGAIILPDKWLPRRAISEPGDDPEWQRIPGRSYPFRFDRRQLEAVLEAARTAASPEDADSTGLVPRDVGAGTEMHANDLSAGQGRRRGGRVAAGFWEEAKREAMRWLEENGFPASNDGNQAKLERHILDWLEQRNHKTSEATVRRHVREYIKWYREQIES